MKKKLSKRLLPVISKLQEQSNKLLKMVNADESDKGVDLEQHVIDDLYNHAITLSVDIKMIIEDLEYIGEE